MLNIDWDLVKRLTRDRTEELCSYFFASGRRYAHEWLMGNVAGEPGESLKIELEGERAGLFIDFASNESGDFIDLLCRAKGTNKAGAAELIGNALGVSVRTGTGPNPANAYSTNAKANSAAPSINWDDYRPGAKQMQELAAWRGYSENFCHWLAANNYIGRQGAHWCFPVQDSAGKPIAVHKRLDKNRYAFEPSLKTIGQSLTPLVVGDLASADYLLITESQWDLFSGLDVLGIADGEPVAGLCTRGAKNAGLVANLQFAGDWYAVGQNDDPGRAWLDQLKTVHPFKLVPVPANFHDLNDWIKADSANRIEFLNAWARARNYRASFPPLLVSGDEIQKVILPLPQSVIEGVLSRGEKFQLAGGSKSSKTWALIDLAICVAAGLSWWGFKTYQTPVIYLNLELPREYFEQRVRAVAKAHRIAVPSLFHVWHLRGARLYDPDHWKAFKTALLEETVYLPHPLILIDPLYKLMGRGNELHTGDVQIMLDSIEEIIELVKGLCGASHHYSKGNQAAKEAIDRGSGSGVFQRDVDTLFPITRLATPDCFSIEPYLRNHAAISPFGLRWDLPLFFPDPSLDPADLKTAQKSRGPGRGNAYSYIAPEQALTYISSVEEITRLQFQERLIEPGKNGRPFCAKSRAYEIIRELIDDGRLVERTEGRKTYLRKA